MSKQYLFKILISLVNTQLSECVYVVYVHAHACVHACVSSYLNYLKIFLWKYCFFLSADKFITYQDESDNKLWMIFFFL